MKTYEATEQAYKNGYEKGRKDAIRWIPVTESMPEANVLVLGLAQTKQFAKFIPLPVIWVENGWVCSLTSRYVACSHWIPIPEIPKVGDGNA